MQNSLLRHQIYRVFRFNVLAFVMRLVTSAVMARIMGPAAMGLWVLLSLLPIYAEGFGRVKADLAAVYVLGRCRWSLGEVCGALNVIALWSGGACAVVLLLSERWLSHWLFGSQHVGSLLYRLTVLAIPVHFLAMGYAYLLLHFKDVSAYNTQNFLRTVFPGVMASVLLLLTPLRVGALVVSLLTGGAMGLVYGAWVVHRRDKLRRVVQPGLYGTLLGVGRRLYLAGAIEQLNVYLGSLLVGVHLAAQDLAFFRLGQDRLQVLDQIPSAVNTLLYPHISATAVVDEQVALVAKSIRVLIVLLAAAGAVGGLLAPFVIRLLYGKAFIPMVWSVWLLLPGALALGMSSPATQYFMGSGRAGLVWKVALVPLLMQAGLLLPFIKLWGFRGAALAVSLSFVAHAAARLLVLTRITGCTATDLCVPTREDLALVVTLVKERMQPFLLWRSRTWPLRAP